MTNITTMRPGGYGGHRMNLGTVIKCCPLCGERIKDRLQAERKNTK